MHSDRTWWLHPREREREGEGEGEESQKVSKTQWWTNCKQIWQRQTKHVKLLYPALLGVHLEELSFSELLAEHSKDWVHDHWPTTPGGDREIGLTSHRRIEETLSNSLDRQTDRQADKGTRTVVVNCKVWNVMHCHAAVFNPPICCEVHDHKRLSCLSQLTFKLSITSDDPHTSLWLSHLEAREREGRLSTRKPLIVHTDITWQAG